MNKDYENMTEEELRAEFETEKKSWKSLPRKSSFSGLSISDKLNRIQQTMEERDYDFTPLYMEINMLG